MDQCHTKSTSSSQSDHLRLQYSLISSFSNYGKLLYIVARAHLCFVEFVFIEEKNELLEEIIWKQKDLDVLCFPYKIKWTYMNICHYMFLQIYFEV